MKVALSLESWVSKGLMFTNLVQKRMMAQVDQLRLLLRSLLSLGKKASTRLVLGHRVPLLCLNCNLGTSKLGSEVDQHSNKGAVT
jgi:hypothetical protein